MLENARVQELEREKESYIVHRYAAGNKVTLKDIDKLTEFDREIYFAKNPRIKKLNDWLFPENVDGNGEKNTKKNMLKGMGRRLAALPVTIGYSFCLDFAVRRWEKKNIKNVPNKENRRRLRMMRIVRGWSSAAIVPMDALFTKEDWERINSEIPQTTEKKKSSFWSKFKGMPLSGGDYGYLLAEATANSPSLQKPIDPELKRQLQGIGDKPKNPVHVTEVDNRVIAESMTGKGIYK